MFPGFATVELRPRLELMLILIRSYSVNFSSQESQDMLDCRASVRSKMAGKARYMLIVFVHVVIVKTEPKCALLLS